MGVTIMIPTSIDGTDITGATIDGTDVQEITVDGDTVFTSVPSSLVSHYEFENDLTDSVGSNDLTNNGNGQFTSSSKFGSFAKSYDGSDDFDSIESNLVNPSGPFTVSAFFKTSSDGTIWSQANSSTIDPFLWLEVDGGSLTFYKRTNVGSQVEANGTVSVDDGSYHHGAITYDGTTMALFTDGGDKQTLNDSAIPNTDHAAFGALYRPSAILFFQGDIDDAKIFDEVLTDTQISNLSSTGSI